MNTLPEESIGLTSRGLYLDDANASSDSHISASDTLLEDDTEYMNTNFQQGPKWRKMFSSQIKARRKPSRPINDYAETNTLGRRKGSGMCLKFGLGTLVAL